MARPAPPPPLNPYRFLRDLVLVLGVAALVVAAIVRWVAVPWAVDGPSMEPSLEEGDRVIVAILRRGERPRVGQVVLLEGPGDEPLVKRIGTPQSAAGAIPAPEIPTESALEPTYVVLGDNPSASSDSRVFGPVPLHRIRGVVVWRYWPLARFGPIR